MPRRFPALKRRAIFLLSQGDKFLPSHHFENCLSNDQGLPGGRSLLEGLDCPRLGGGCCLCCIFCCCCSCLCCNCCVCCWCFCSTCCFADSLAFCCVRRWCSWSCFCWSFCCF